MYHNLHFLHCKTFSLTAAQIIMKIYFLGVGITEEFISQCVVGGLVLCM